LSFLRASSFVIRHFRCCAGAQQRRHFVLHAFELTQTQLRVAHNKDVAIFAMLVDEQTTSVGSFSANLFQHAFALEHYREDETGVRRRIRFHDQAAKKLLRVFFRQWLGGRCWRRFEFRFPK